MKRTLFLFLSVVSVMGMIAISGITNRVLGQSGALNGHEYADLGLPSGTKWATCNVGANKPEEYGDYFAWGETKTKKKYGYNNYKYSGNPSSLSPKSDAATANWGDGWRMPTETEMQELVDNCDVTWTTLNGKNGMLFTSRTNGNTIFLPAAGCRVDDFSVDAGSDSYYWSSSLNTEEPDGAWFLTLDSDSYSVMDTYRYLGFTIRPVCVTQN